MTYRFSERTRSIYGSILDIDPTTGIIRVIGVIDFERDPVMELSIIAQDAGVNPRTALTRVAIRVLDHNDEAPTISIHVPRDSGFGRVSEGKFSSCS